DCNYAAGRGITWLEMPQSNIFLERRRPDAAGCVTDLIAVGVQRDHPAPSRERVWNREAEGMVLSFEFGVINLQTRQHYCRTARPFGQQSLSPDELAFVPAYRPTESQFERRRGLSIDHSFVGRRVIHVEHD